MSTNHGYPGQRVPRTTSCPEKDCQRIRLSTNARTDPVANVKRFILVLAHTEAQIVCLTRNQPFFHHALRADALKRVKSNRDIRGMALQGVLYLLPDYEKGTLDAHQILGYWKDCKNEVVTLTDDQICGRMPFVPPEPEMELGDASERKQYDEFPRYSGKPRPALRYFEERPPEPSESEHQRRMGLLP